MINTKKLIDRQKQANDRVPDGKGQRSQLWKITEGEHKVYIHPPCLPDDDFEFTSGLNYIEVKIHYGAKGVKGGHICLDVENNPVLRHPLVMEALENRRNNPLIVNDDLYCPTCQGPKAESHRLADRFIFGLTPLFYRKDKKSLFTSVRAEPRVYIAGNQVYNGIVGEMIDLQDQDITNPDSAVLIQIGRVGVEFTETEYSVKADKDSLRKPYRLSDSERAAVEEALQGSCNLFRVFVAFVKTPDQLLEAANGSAPAKSDRRFSKPEKPASRLRNQAVQAKPRKPEPEPEVEPEPEPEVEPEPEPEVESQPDMSEETPQCFGEFEEVKACLDCGVMDECREAVAELNSQEGPADSKGVAIPDGDDEDAELARIKAQVNKIQQERKRS